MVAETTHPQPDAGKKCTSPSQICVSCHTDKKQQTPTEQQNGPEAQTQSNHNQPPRALMENSTHQYFFSVQRLHGFRQVVTHVQSQQKDEL